MLCDLVEMFCDMLRRYASDTLKGDEGGKQVL